MTQKVIAMVLAGGKGKGMDILCHSRPKPALTFGGCFRVIDFSLSNCLHSGINDVAVLIDYQRCQMGDHLNRWRAVNAPGRLLDLLEPRNGCYRGTADALYQNLKYLRNSEAELVLVLAGDQVYKMVYTDLVDFHIKSGADATVAVISVPMEQAYRFGTIVLDSDCRITDFVEKSAQPLSTLASMGIYVFNKDILLERLSEDAGRQDSPHDFGYAIVPDMVRRDKVFAYEFQGYWQDIDCKDTFYSATMDLIGKTPAFSLDGEWAILTEKQESVPLQRINRGNIRNCLVSPGCIIRGRVENSVLSPGVKVEEMAIVRDSILMSGVSVGYHSVVDRCILDEEVNVSRYCYIGFNANLLVPEQEITVVGKGATVPNYTALGRNCTILPRVEASDFPGNIIPSGTILSPRSLAAF